MNRQAPRHNYSMCATVAQVYFETVKTVDAPGS